MLIAYLNGEYLPLEQASVPAMDRGYLFGDAVYEVIPVYQGKPFHLLEHLNRLAKSLEAIRLESAINPILWQIICHELVARNGGGNQSIYIQISRGAVAKREHTFPESPHPTVFAYSQPYIPLAIETLRAGGSAITLPDIRWSQCYIKSTNLLANVLLRQQAKDQGADEAILIHNGYAIEGTASNLFIVREGTIQTPPLQHHILGGVTRNFILEIAEREGVPHTETSIPEADLYQADEIWLTGSLREIQPIVKLNNKSVGTGKAGGLWEEMIQLYREGMKKLK